jgi:hypothetical protein
LRLRERRSVARPHAHCGDREHQPDREPAELPAIGRTANVPQAARRVAQGGGELPAIREAERVAQVSAKQRRAAFAVRDLVGVRGNEPLDHGDLVHGRGSVEMPLSRVYSTSGGWSGDRWRIAT